MALEKTAITVPEELFASVGELARARGESRSAFITRVLRAALRARRDRRITQQLDALFADEDLSEEQVRTAGELDRAAGEWDGERW